jgi:CO dehydrogenase maturation factor
MLVVVEPGARSIATARRIMDLASEIGVGSFAIVGNKMRDRHQEEWVAGQFPSMRIAGMIPYSEAIAEADLRGKPALEMLDQGLRADFERLYHAISNTEDK